MGNCRQQQSQGALGRRLQRAGKRQQFQLQSIETLGVGGDAHDVGDVGRHFSQISHQSAGSSSGAAVERVQCVHRGVQCGARLAIRRG